MSPAPENDMQLSIDECAALIQQILLEKLFVEVDSFDDDLLQAGLLDSLALIQLLVHLEERFAVKVSLDDLEIDDLRTIRSIARMVASRKIAASEGAEKAESNAIPVHG